MYLWRKIAEPRWVRAHEDILQARSAGSLAIISNPGRKRQQLEIACTSRNDSQRFVEEFGGRTEKLPRDWLERFARLQQSKPIKVGKRLVVAGKVDFQTPNAFVLNQSSLLIIPASMAFGTGEHATTAMSLRLLERLTRQWKNGWSLADLGTGTGILALAAKRFGAGSVIGIDEDARAISVAKANARLNKIHDIDFKLGDVRKSKSWAGRDIIAANLYRELLIEILPNLRRGGWLVFSGVLRLHERKFFHALRRNKIEIATTRRRGKWVAVLAKAPHFPPSWEFGRRPD
jgi:ribosomal protein L11 methyltransferase